MSKMREAFEALYINISGNIKPGSEEWYEELQWRTFEAGYQAAIAAVKEGGVPTELHNGRIAVIYKLPED